MMNRYFKALLLSDLVVLLPSSSGRNRVSVVGYCVWGLG